MFNIKHFKNLKTKSIKYSYDLIKKNKQLNIFFEILKNKQSKSKKVLSNIPFVIKNNFNYKDFKLEIGSNTLKNHKAITTATVVKRLISAGAIPVATTSLDEYSMGGVGLIFNNGFITNPLDSTRITSGSSAGTAVAVQMGIVPFGLGSDTGDSIRRPAAFCGIVGFKPTWGLLSRNGLFTFSPSLDCVGFISNNVEDQALLLEKTTGYDKKDTTSCNKKTIKYSGLLKANLSGLKIVYFKELIEYYNKEYIIQFKTLINKMKKLGAIIKEITFSEKLFKTLCPVYQTITFGEALSQLSAINGLTFAKRSTGNNFFEMVLNTRTENMGNLVKQRLLSGAYSISEENQKDVFIKSKKIRTLFIKRIQEIFSQYDGIINIAAKIAPKIKEIKPDSTVCPNYQDFSLVIANLVGAPSITIPIGTVDKMPFSIEIMTNIFKDTECLNIALAVETIIKGDK